MATRGALVVPAAKTKSKPSNATKTSAHSSSASSISTATTVSTTGTTSTTSTTYSRESDRGPYYGSATSPPEEHVFYKTVNEPAVVELTTERLMRLSDKALAAYEYLRMKTGDKGVIDYGKPNPAPKACHESLFEFTFDRPKNAINIPRDFFPQSGTYDAIHEHASRHAFDLKEDSVDQMHAFILELRRKVKSKIRADIAVQHAHDIRQAKIVVPGENRTAINKEDLFKAWTQGNPDGELIQKIHGLLYNSLTREVINSITYRCYLEFGLWLDKDADDIFLVAKNGVRKAKACSIHHMVVTTAREHVRARFARKALIPHGIILTVSKDSSSDSTKEMARLKTSDLKKIRQSKAFDFKRFVKGWRGTAHIKYCKDHGYEIPVIPELDPELAKEVQKKKKTPPASKRLQLDYPDTHRNEAPKKMKKNNRAANPFMRLGPKSDESSDVDMDSDSESGSSNSGIAHAATLFQQKRSPEKRVREFLRM